MTAPATDDLTPALLYLDAHLAVVDKPAGLLVHRTALAAGTDEAALQQVRDRLGAPVFPVHRLDRGTSGVLVFARSPEATRRLAAQFECGSVDKRYLALVRGWPAELGVVDHPLARDPEAPSTGQTLLAARTAWRRLGCVEWPVVVDPRFSGCRCALLEVQALSGRRHQIRRHFKQLAHPLIGDSTHGKGALNRALASAWGTSRLWLHAHRLTLRHPVSDLPLTIEAAPGPEWRQLAAMGAWRWELGAIPQMLTAVSA